MMFLYAARILAKERDTPSAAEICPKVTAVRGRFFRLLSDFCTSQPLRATPYPPHNKS
jgi:hypothetical protein